MIISLCNLLQYHSIVRWAVQAQWAEPLVLCLKCDHLIQDYLQVFLVILDIPLADWLKTKGEEIGNTMSSAVANKLLDELGLTNLMNPVPCDRYNGIFADTVNGWNSKGMDRIVYTCWLSIRVITLLLSPRYQLFSEAMLRKIVGTEGTIKVLLPEYQVYKCFIILNNCNSKF